MFVLYSWPDDTSCLSGYFLLCTCYFIAHRWLSIYIFLFTWYFIAQMAVTHKTSQHNIYILYICNNSYSLHFLTDVIETKYLNKNFTICEMFLLLAYIKSIRYMNEGVKYSCDQCSYIARSKSIKSWGYFLVSLWQIVY